MSNWFVYIYFYNKSFNIYFFKSIFYIFVYNKSVVCLLFNSLTGNATIYELPGEALIYHICLNIPIFKKGPSVEKQKLNFLQTILGLDCWVAGVGSLVRKFLQNCRKWFQVERQPFFNQILVWPNGCNNHPICFLHKYSLTNSF